VHRRYVARAIMRIPARTAEQAVSTAQPSSSSKRISTALHIRVVVLLRRRFGDRVYAVTVARGQEDIDVSWYMNLCSRNIHRSVLRVVDSATRYGRAVSTIMPAC
jgi:hypothetical protein